MQRWIAIAAMTATLAGLPAFTNNVWVISSGVARSQGRVYDLRPFFGGDRATPAPARTQSQAGAADASSLQALEAAVREQINAYRAGQGLPPLAANARMDAVAREHSAAMAAGRVRFSHDGFDRRAATLRRSLPYRSVAENLAFNQGSAEPATVAVRGWLESPGHQQNIVGSFDLTGVGVARAADGSYYFTQLFLRQR